MTSSTPLPALLESFFTDRLMQQRQASEHTIASYRDTFRLVLAYAHRRLKKAPSELALEDLNAAFIGSFLSHLEKERRNSARSRNQRLAAIHSFFRYVALREPRRAALVQQVLAIPSKRYDRALVAFLTRAEIDALIATPDCSTRAGRRDHALLLLAVQTGLRASELRTLRRDDVVFGVGAHVRCRGKGRKERCTPLTKHAAKVLQVWLRECEEPSDSPLFPSARGGPLSGDGVGYIVAKHATAATRTCPSLMRKRITPHALRHTTAVQLLQAGVDRSVIALWLGHERVETTQMYLDANLAMKEEVLAKTAPVGVLQRRFRANDRLLAFLNSL